MNIGKRSRYRIRLIHRNVPGVMARVNQIFAASEANVDAQVDLLSSLVKLRAKENGVAFGVLASHDDLTKIARGHYDQTDVLKGWRRTLIGDDLLALMNGEMALTIEGGVLKVTNASQQA